MRTALFVIVAAITVTTCGGGGGSSPAAPAGTIAAFIKIQGHLGTFSLTLANQTITTDGDHQFNVPAGVQQVTGTMTVDAPANGEPMGLQMLFHGATGQDTGQLGGPQRGTIQSLEGPRPFMQDGCNLAYSNSGSTAQTFQLRFQFTVSTSASGKC